MTVPVVSAIIVHGISGEQPVHYLGDRNGASYQQQVEVVRNQRPSKAWCCCFAKDISQPSDKIVAIRIILKYLSTLDSAADDMVQSARRKHPAGRRRAVAQQTVAK